MLNTKKWVYTSKLLIVYFVYIDKLLITKFNYLTLYFLLPTQHLLQLTTTLKAFEIRAATDKTAVNKNCRHSTVIVLTFKSLLDWITFAHGLNMVHFQVTCHAWQNRLGTCTIWARYPAKNHSLMSSYSLTDKTWHFSLLIL